MNTHQMYSTRAGRDYEVLRTVVVYDAYSLLDPALRCDEFLRAWLSVLSMLNGRIVLIAKCRVAAEP